MGYYRDMGLGACGGDGVGGGMGLCLGVGGIWCGGRLGWDRDGGGGMGLGWGGGGGDVHYCPHFQMFCTAVERASCEVHKLLHAGEVPTALTTIVLAVAGGLFGLCGSGTLG